MRHPAHHIFQFTPDALRAWCDERGMASYRATQILDWVYRKGVIDPASMLNLSKRERETLSAEVAFLSGRTVAERVASDGTRKLLIEWADFGAEVASGAAGNGAVALPMVGEPGAGGDPSRQTECVMIPALSAGDSGPRERRTACISSQVGCPVGCRFCASGLGGLDGNLSAGRIVEQVWRLNALLAPERITNVVFMGMGEPLANFAAVKQAVETLAAPWGMGISARKITISTVGLPSICMYIVPS